MADWLDYSLSDFLLFAPETYWRVFQRLNSDYWPLPWILPPILAALVLLSPGRSRRAGIVVGLGLGGAWLFIAQTFLAWYAEINWVIGYLVPVFWAQALLMTLLVPRLMRADGLRAAVPGAALTVLSIAYPILAALSGRALAQAEVAGLAPDPTAILTLGALALLQPGWFRLLLTIAPAIWLSISAATLLTMDDLQGWVPLAALLFALFWRLPGVGVPVSNRPPDRNAG